MGGYGSGRRWHFDAKEITGDYRSIDVRRWQKKKLLIPGQEFSCQWFSDGNIKSSIGVRTATDHVVLSYHHQSKHTDLVRLEYPIRLDWSHCHLGGRRPWFICPIKGCGKRVAILYSNVIFSCRHCSHLVYSSQREPIHDRAANQADKIRDKLEWEPGILNGDGPKPKGMHWTTFKRLKAKHNALVQISLSEAALKFGLDVWDFM